MTTEDAIYMADMALARAGLTPEAYARAKGIVTATNIPTRLLITTEQAQELLAIGATNWARKIREDKTLAACCRRVGGLNLWHVPSLMAWAEPTPAESR